jgi:5-carboxymethyl-2-hydroxymuconate isomerase
MTPREITSLMKRLFRYETGGNDAWRHLMSGNGFDAHACEELLRSYISDEEVLVFVDRQHATHCSISEAVGFIENFMKLGYVRVANRAFTSKVIIAPIGVGQGYNSRAGQSPSSALHLVWNNMPHLTIEYTDNLPQFNASGALVALNNALVASGQFEEIDIKSRAIRIGTFLVGTSPDDRAFVHVKLAILSGRSIQIKHELSESLLLVLKAICARD